MNENMNNNYDTALKLRIDFDKGIRISDNEALEQLKTSELIKELTNEIIDKPLYYIWRIIALSEIPYTRNLEYTKLLADKIFSTMGTLFGFSLSGDKKMFLPCYNAMLVSALSKLGYADNQYVKNGAEWIYTYQPMARGVEVSIPNFRFDRYGGCFKQTPCYINIAKSVNALMQFQKASGNTKYKAKIDEGIEYMLNHHLYKRLSVNKPITRNILNISFPESYHLNIVELIQIIKEANKVDDLRVGNVIDYLNEIKVNGGWEINYRYKADGYMVFDKGRGVGNWVSYIIRKSIQ